MLSQTSNEFRTLFLLQFTKELISNTEQPQKPMTPVMQKSILMPPKQLLSPQRKIIFKPLPRIPRRKPMQLLIPEPKLPPNLQYLKPTPTDTYIELGKLNPLTKDPAVKIIECHGPDEKIIVKGTMGTKPTNIILSKDEIDDIIKKFSESAKIPVQEGVFNVAVGKFILSAITSRIIGSKFIIEKMIVNKPVFN